MHHCVHALNVANLVLIFVLFRSIASYRDILRKRALIANNEIMTLRVFSYKKMIMKMINRTISAHSLAIARNLDLSKTIENLFDDDYQN